MVIFGLIPSPLHTKQSHDQWSQICVFILYQTMVTLEGVWYWVERIDLIWVCSSTARIRKESTFHWRKKKNTKKQIYGNPRWINFGCLQNTLPPTPKSDVICCPHGTPQWAKGENRTDQGNHFLIDQAWLGFIKNIIPTRTNSQFHKPKWWGWWLWLGLPH